MYWNLERIAKLICLKRFLKRARSSLICILLRLYSDDHPPSPPVNISQKESQDAECNVILSYTREPLLQYIIGTQQLDFLGNCQCRLSFLDNMHKEARAQVHIIRYHTKGIIIIYLSNNVGTWTLLRYPFQGLFKT